VPEKRMRNEKLTDEFSRIEMRASMTGSIISKAGVMDVMSASIRPAKRCKSGLSFNSLNSKISGLSSQLTSTTAQEAWGEAYRIGMIYGNAEAACTSDNSTDNQARAKIISYAQGFPGVG
jgi:hypothetical protein